MGNESDIKILEINGLRVLYLRNKSFLTNIQILTNVGSSAENESNYGMAHILEHMFFKGSTTRQGGTAISRAANDIGGKLNAYTTYDHTVYYITVLNEKFGTGMDILADMYQNPTFPPEEFAKELNPILSELREREDDPDNYILERAMKQMMGNNYHPVIGYKETIESATVEKMHQFKDKYYGGNNTMLSIVGGISEEEVRKVVEKCFSPSAATQAPSASKCEFKSGELTLTKPGIQEAYYYMFYPALPARHPERYKQDMMNYILGGNDSSLLFERVREERGMSCYGIYSWIMRYDSFSLLSISCGIAQEELEQLEEEVYAQIKKIKAGEVEEDRLLRARASLRTSIASKSETSTGLGSLVSVPFLKGETEDPVEKALREIESIGLKEIQEYAEKTFAVEPFKAVLLPE